MRLLFVIGFVACHAMVIGLGAQHAAAASMAWLVLAPLLAGLACVLRGRDDAARGGWVASGAAMWLWAGGMAATLVATITTPQANSVSELPMLLYVLYGVPLTFVLASPRQATRRERAIDAALALALGWLFFVHTRTFAGLADEDPALAQLRLMFDVENVFILLFALVRLAASEVAAERALFRTLSVFACAYLLVAGWINHLHHDVPFGTFVDLVIGLPFLLLVLLAPGRHAGDIAGNVRVARIVRAGSPLVLPLGLLIVSVFLVQTHPGWAVAGFAVALVGYGARSVLSQMQWLEQRECLDTLARVDALTGLANRRQFDEIATRAFARARDDAREIAVLMIDIDHFKQLNDALGHGVGDTCLQAVAHALAGGAARSGDLVARYGGEEFIVLLPDCAGDGALRVAERMRAEVQALGLSTPAGEGMVTVSIGAAHAVPTGAATLSALIEAADVALYDTKAAGRNRVVARVPDIAID